MGEGLEAAGAGLRDPGGAPPGWEGAPLAGGAGPLPALPGGLLPPLLLLVPPDASVRFKAAGPISAWNREERKQNGETLLKKSVDQKLTKKDGQILFEKEKPIKLCR